MADPSFVALLSAGCTAGGIVAGFMVKSVRRNSNNKPLTEERHELLCERNLLLLSKEFQKVVSKEVGKLYDAIKEVTR